MEGKKEFYGKIEEALKSKGYDYYDGDRITMVIGIFQAKEDNTPINLIL